MALPDEFAVNENTRPEEAIKIAIEREDRAREFYLRCAEVVADPGVKKMFEFLAREEGRHHDLLERERDRFLQKEY